MFAYVFLCFWFYYFEEQDFKCNLIIIKVNSFTIIKLHFHGSKGKNETGSLKTATKREFTICEYFEILFLSRYLGAYGSRWGKIASFRKRDISIGVEVGSHQIYRRKVPQPQPHTPSRFPWFPVLRRKSTGCYQVAIVARNYCP